MVPNWQKTTIAKWALKALEADTHVVSDGLATFAAVKEAGFTHEPIVVGSTGKAAGSHPRFLAVNTTLGNLKTWGLDVQGLQAEPLLAALLGGIPVPLQQTL